MAQTNSTAIQDTVIEIVASALRIKPDKITLDSHLEKDLGADSLDALNITEKFEEAYQIDIPNEEMPNFVTIRAMVEGIEKHLKEREGA